MLKHTILLDLSLAFHGYSGIPQDSRLMFKTLATMPSVDLTGLVFESGSTLTRRARIKPRQADKKNLELLDSSIYMMALSGIGKSGKEKNIVEIAKEIYREHSRRYNPSFRLKRIDDKFLLDVLWRLVFKQTLRASDRALILSKKFVISDMMLKEVADYVLHSDGVFSPRKPRLNTRGHEFIIFHDSRPVTVSKGTISLYRYHDALPITHSDTFSNVKDARFHFRSINECQHMGFYVCNSEVTRRQLVSLFPMLEDRSFTVPYALPSVVEPASQFISAAEIASVRLCPAALRGASASLKNQVLKEAQLDKPFRFIMALSTLEPRKNFIGVIEAWERLLYRYDPSLKLVIVGKPGWRVDAILDAIAPRLLTGQLLHLEGLPFAEVQALYRRAECLVFPSFGEGFGFPPMEALQCETPSVVSDLEVHRWVMEDSVLYADPYDVDDIAAQIARLVFGDDRQALRARLLANGRRVLDRYTVDTVAGQWEALFATLKERQRQSAPSESAVSRHATA